MVSFWGRAKADGGVWTADFKHPAWDPGWVAAQEQSADGCQQVARQLAELIEDLTSQVCDQPIGPKASAFCGYLQRLWVCIEYHWKRLAQAKPMRLAQVLGQIRPDEDSLKGDIPAEVILAQALEWGHERAAELFQDQYMPAVRAIARRLGGHRAVDGVENFAAELVLPRDPRPPRIATFQGRTTLSHWLVPVVSNFWRTQMRGRRWMPLELAADPAAVDQAQPTIVESPCQRLLEPIFVHTAEALGPEDRLLLQMLVLDGVPQKELARSLGLHSGTLTRRRQRAAECLLNRVWQLTADSPDPRQVNHCLHLVLAGDDPELRGRLATVLAQGLRGTRPDDQENGP